jgi:hypothetical protein
LDLTSVKGYVVNLKHYDKCIQKNLINKGKKSRLVKGHKGRTKDQVSEQTRIALKERLKNPDMIKKMKESGTKLGKSQLGNKKRWGGKDE